MPFGQDSLSRRLSSPSLREGWGGGMVEGADEAIPTSSIDSK